MSGFWDSAWSAITAASKWMSDNKEMTNLIGGTMMGVGGYFAQKEASRDLMRQQREAFELQDKLKSKYSAVPDDIDFTYNSLVVDDRPNLANGGILTEMKKRGESKY